MNITAGKLHGLCMLWARINKVLIIENKQDFAESHLHMSCRRSEVIQWKSRHPITHLVKRDAQRECWLCDLSSITKSIATDKSIKISSVRSPSALHRRPFSIRGSYYAIQSSNVLEQAAFIASGCNSLLQFATGTELKTFPLSSKLAFFFLVSCVRYPDVL